MYYQLNKEERYLIDKMFNIEQKSIRYIAKILNRSPSSISREIYRNTNYYGKYDYEYANKKSKERSWHNHSMYLLKYLKFTDTFINIYNKNVCGVKQTYYKLRQKKIVAVSWQQIYNWIKSYRWVLTKKDILRKYYVKGRKRKLGIYSKFKDKRVLPIWVRPKNIDLREEFGHWELDLIIGKKASGFDNLLTFCERKTRMLFICRIKSKNPMKVNSCLYKLIKANNLKVKTITTDNGIEFEKIGILANWIDCQVYYCEPYASYQKGSNEHLNGIIRRFYKKGFDFSTITDSDINDMQNQINHMSREIFNWKSSYDLYEYENKT